MKRKTLALVLAVFIASPSAGAAAAAKFTLPEPTGRYPIGTTELHLVDHNRIDPWGAGRHREVMVSLWYPAWPSARPVASHMHPAVADFYHSQLPADFTSTRTHAPIDAVALPGKRPVVLYSPGGGHSRALGTTLVEDLASRGFVVVAVDHTYAGPVQLPDRFEPPGRGVDRVLMMKERVRDVSFVLDQLAAHPNLDLSRVGMFGHSMGGFTAAEAMITERRIDAGINLDGSMDPGYGQAATRGADRPFLLMGGGTSGDENKPHTHQDAPDWASFWANSTGWKRDIHLPEAEHMSFADIQVILPQINQQSPLPPELMATIGTVDPQRSLAAQQAYVAAFFDLHLRGRATELFDRDSPAHPDARLVP